MDEEQLPEVLFEPFHLKAYGSRCKPTFVGGARKAAARRKIASSVSGNSSFNEFSYPLSLNKKRRLGAVFVASLDYPRLPVGRQRVSD